jgi:hypothetical protein
MQYLLDFNFFTFLNVYLLVTFILGTALRVKQYRIIVGLVLALPERWPNLSQLLMKHKTIFLTWKTLLPLIVTFAMMLINYIAYKWVWPMAEITPNSLWDRPLTLVYLVPVTALMLFLDIRAVFIIGKIERTELDPYFDQAEYWLRSWVAPAVKILTFGFINPRRMVHEEVRKALEAVGDQLSRMMWQWALQVTMRLLFGLSLWLTWALA